MPLRAARPCDPRNGEGVSNLYRSGARYRTGSHAQIFFLRGGGLIYFPEIKEFKASPADFLNPINGARLSLAALTGFIFRRSRCRPFARKNAAKFGVGGVGMEARHDG